MSFDGKRFGGIFAKKINENGSVFDVQRSQKSKLEKGFNGLNKSRITTLKIAQGSFGRLPQNPTWVKGLDPKPNLDPVVDEEFGVNRSVESLCGKKYHILRKKGRTNARSHNSCDRRKRPGSSRRSVGMKASQSDGSVKAAVQSNIDLWFQTVLMPDPSLTDSSELTRTWNSISGMSPPSFDAGAYQFLSQEVTNVILDLGVCTPCQRHWEAGAVKYSAQSGCEVLQEKICG
ncbi:hypothetical protein N7451_012616 [Penicillium sp. IBT 35674x]|nr:hypothetical protein N7451_012616 [Penicillium sp. IBT 35674x]